MELDTVQQIERAIAGLNRDQLTELYAWLDRYDPQPIDARLRDDLASGRLDRAILNALEDEKHGRTQSL